MWRGSPFAAHSQVIITSPTGIPARSSLSATWWRPMRWRIESALTSKPFCDWCARFQTNNVFRCSYVEGQPVVPTCEHESRSSRNRSASDWVGRRDDRPRDWRTRSKPSPRKRRATIAMDAENSVPSQYRNRHQGTIKKLWDNCRVKFVSVGSGT